MKKHSLTYTRFFAFVALLVSIGIVVWTDYPNQKPKVEQYTPKPLPRLAQRPLPKYDIVSANLFGNPDTQTNSEIAPKGSALNLKLLGILSASDTKMSRVMIESNDGRIEVYSQSDYIKGLETEVFIEQIRTLDVVLNHNDNHEILTMTVEESDNDGNQNVFEDEESTPVPDSSITDALANNQALLDNLSSLDISPEDQKFHELRKARQSNRITINSPKTALP